MRIYEELFIVDPNATDEQIDAVVAQVEELIKESGGSIDKVDKWGKRRLAYRVRKNGEGIYILIQFSARAETVRELERRFRVDELVLKYITVRIDEKMKWLEKRKKIREKRAARRPKPTHSAPPAHSPSAPAPPAAVPGTPKAPAADAPPPAPVPEGGK